MSIPQEDKDLMLLFPFVIRHSIHVFQTFLLGWVLKVEVRMMVVKVRDVSWFQGYGLGVGVKVRVVGWGVG
jgi:hypothetical protein